MKSDLCILNPGVLDEFPIFLIVERGLLDLWRLFKRALKGALGKCI